jgi:hypothetical protein
MSDRDWAKEMAKIDKQLESVSDEAIFPRSQAKTPAAKAEIVEKQKSTRSWGMLARLVLTLLLGVGVAFWPYEARCGLGLAAYLGGISVVVVSGVWSAVWSWRHRSPRAHVLSLLVLLWGLILGAMEVLPRIGYANDASRPASWSCSQLVGS